MWYVEFFCTFAIQSSLVDDVSLLKKIIIIIKIIIKIKIKIKIMIMVIILYNPVLEIVLFTNWIN